MHRKKAMPERAVRGLQRQPLCSMPSILSKSTKLGEHKQNDTPGLSLVAALFRCAAPSIPFKIILQEQFRQEMVSAWCPASQLKSRPLQRVWVFENHRTVQIGFQVGLACVLNFTLPHIFVQTIHQRMQPLLATWPGRVSIDMSRCGRLELRSLRYSRIEVTTRRATDAWLRQRRGAAA